MKKKIYMILCVVIQMIISIYTIINAKAILSSMNSELQTLMASLPEELNGFLNASASLYNLKFIYGSAILSLIALTIILLVILFSKSLYRNKTLLIVLTVLTFFFSLFELSYLFIVINIVLFSTLKPSKDDENIKNDIPVIKDKKRTAGDIILALLMIGIYAFLISGGFGLFDKIISAKYEIFFRIFIYIFLMAISLIIFYEDITSNFKLFFKNFRAYMSFVFSKLKIGYIIYFAVAIITLILKGNISQNQEELMELPKYFVIPLALIYAPFVEETVFRMSIRKIFKNDYLFIIVSALSFGLVHTMGEASLYNVIVAGLPYITLGGILAYLYTKSNNTATNMFTHFLQNSVASLIMLFL